jgi:5-methylcytosine-specific restriction protein A
MPATDPRYRLKRWADLRRTILVRDGFTCQWPGCGIPLGQGRRRASAAVVDHKTPHKGDAALFWNPDNLWALCKEHHDSAKQSEERLGFSTAVGPDGYPIDARHPSNR